MALHFSSPIPHNSHFHMFLPLTPAMEPVPAIGFPLFADSLHASKRLRSFSSSPVAVPPATLLDTTLSLSSSNPIATPPPCRPCHGATLEQCSPAPCAPCDGNTNAALPFLAMLRRFKPQGAHMIPHISHMISASPLQRTNQPLATVHAATPAAVPAARCPLPPVEALRRAVKRSHAAAGLDEEVTSRPRAALPSNLPSHLPSNALAAGAAASGLPAVLPSDADVAERLVKYDRLTSSLRGSLPPANLAQWDKAVGKLRDRVAMKEEFGNDVNGFLLFLHAQLGAQQPSARKALQLFAAFKQAQRQKQNAGAAAMGTEVSAADSQRVSVKVQAPFRDYVSSDDDTTSVCSNHPEPAELIEARAEPQAGSTLPRLNSSGPVPSASGFQGEVCSQQRNVEQLRLGQPGAALGIDATCPAVAKKMLFELQSAVVQLERNAAMDVGIKAESLAVLRTAQNHLLSRLASVVRSV